MRKAKEKNSWIIVIITILVIGGVILILHPKKLVDESIIKEKNETVKSYGGIIASFVERFDRKQLTQIPPVFSEPDPTIPKHILMLRTVDFYPQTCYFLNADLTISNNKIKIILRNVTGGGLCGAAMTQATWEAGLNYTIGNYTLQIISEKEGDMYELEFLSDRIEIKPLRSSFSEFENLVYYKTPKTRIVLGCCTPIKPKEKIELCENIKRDLSEIAEEKYGGDIPFIPCAICNPQCTYYDYNGTIEELRRTVEPYLQRPRDESDEIYTIISTLTGEVFCC